MAQLIPFRASVPFTHHPERPLPKLSLLKLNPHLRSPLDDRALQEFLVKSNNDTADSGNYIQPIQELLLSSAISFLAPFSHKQYYTF